MNGWAGGGPAILGHHTVIGYIHISVLPIGPCHYDVIDIVIVKSPGLLSAGLLQVTSTFFLPFLSGVLI